MMKRREFLNSGLSLAAGLLAARTLEVGAAFGADAAQGPGGAKIAKISDKDILKEGQPAVIANYCEHPDKQPNKYCPDWKAKPGHCNVCMFFNTDNSETTFKGGKYAHCKLLTDPKKAQFVSENGYCATFVQKT